MSKKQFLVTALAGLMVLALACGGGDDGAGGSGGGRGEASKGRRGGPPGDGNGRWGGGPGGPAAAAVPVEVQVAVQRTISSYIETNGTLEAETEVDVVARLAGPIVELGAEEGQFVQSGTLLAHIEDEEYRTDLEIAAVNLEETRLAYERAENLRGEELISNQDYDQAKSAYDTARAQHDAAKLRMAYTTVRAPFSGWVVTRYVDFAQQVSVGTALFRMSDFNPLLCPIQVPERELSRLHAGQRAYLTVEPYPGRRFEAHVLRISPVVDAASGTIKVTLQVNAENKLRPGMFARVFVETESRDGAVVVPKAALSLESLGDTVYVAGDGTASRRSVKLGFREGDSVEILEGVEAGEQVVVVGQDGLSDGTPVQVLVAEGAPAGDAPDDSDPPGARADGLADGRPAGAEAGPPGAGGEPGAGPGGRRGRPDVASMTPEQIEGMKERMRSRGMSDEEIERRIRQLREGSQGGGEARP